MKKWTMFLALVMVGFAFLIAAPTAKAADLGSNQVLFTAKPLSAAWCNGITSPTVNLSLVDSTKVGFYYKAWGHRPNIHRILIEESPDGTNWTYPNSVSELTTYATFITSTIQQVNLPPMKYMRVKVYCTPTATGTYLDLQIFKR